MRLISKINHFLSSGSSPKPQISSLLGSKPQTLIFFLFKTRNYAANPARKEDNDHHHDNVEPEEEVVDFDPRKLPADYDPANFDPAAHRSPPTDRVFRLVDEVASLTLMEVSELSQILMKRMGISEAPVVGVMRPGAAAGLAGLVARGNDGKGEKVEEKKEEKSVFDLKLEGFDAASKIKVIKEVRAVTELGLKEAKEMVEKTPAVFKKGVGKEEAEQIIEKMKGVGATVVME